jgi:hypothetical protein
MDSGPPTRLNFWVKFWGMGGKKRLETPRNTPENRSARAARGRGCARAVVCKIGTALEGCPKGLFGAVSSKISRPNSDSEVDSEGPPTRGGKASSAPRGCQRVFRTSGRVLRPWEGTGRVGGIHLAPNYRSAARPHFD